MRAADQDSRAISARQLRHEQRGAGALGLDVEAEDVLEVGQAVVAAEAEVVAEEGQQQRDRSSPG